MSNVMIKSPTWAVLAAGLLAAHLASAQTESWNGSVNQNWSTAGNWSAVAVPGSATNVLFTNSVGSAAAAGAIDNIVNSGFGGTIGALQYANTNTSNGAGFYHTTQIGAGQTLTLTGGLIAGSLTDLGGNAVVNAAITGAGGKLVMSNTSSNLVANQGSGTSGAHTGILNLTNLDVFTATIGRIIVGNASLGVARAEGALYLAKTNFITLSGSAPQIYAGYNNGNNNGNNTFSYIFLGQSNVLAVNSITIGADKNAAVMAFNPAITNGNPVAVFRGGGGGTSRVSSWTLGNNSAQTSTGSTSVGTNDFSNGYLDAMVDSMILGESESGASSGSGSGTGIFTFTAGTNNVNTLYVGYRVATGGNCAGIGAMNVNGTGTLIANNAICLSYWNGGSANAYATGNLNINGGTVLANTITNGVTVSGANNTANITINGGTLGLTSILGTAGTLASPLLNFSAANAALQLQVSGIQTNIEAVTFSPSGLTNLINISYLPPITSYPVTYPLIGFQNLGGTLNVGVSNLPAATPAYQGYVTNDANTVYLVLTSGPTLGSQVDKWTGAAGGNWDAVTVNWSASGSPVTYANGAPVQFDDTATGATNINLTTTLLPASITASNSVLPYILTGTGKISGGAGLTKYGSGTLTVANAGNNDFVGNITINAGAIQFGNGSTNGNLPVTGTITDNGNLIFNHSNNTLVPNTVTGGGTLTQNGNDVVTLTASNSFNGLAVVNTGMLLVNGVLSGALTNAAGATVGGNGTNAGAASISGVIQPSAASGMPATFTLGGLDLLAGATPRFILNGTDSTMGNGVNDLLQVNGDLAANNNAVALNFIGTPQTGVPYTLINYTGNLTGSFATAATGTHFTTAVDQSTPNEINVTLSGSGANLKWDSSVSATWDTGISSNWLNGSSPDVFYAGDNVLLDDTAGVVTNITIGSGVVVYPNVITVSSAVNDFSIGGGQIGGAASIQKSGASVLALNSANTFTGGANVTGGTVRLGANGALGTGLSYFTNGATLDLNLHSASGSVVVSGAGVGGQGVIINSAASANGDQNAFGSGVTVYLQADAKFGSVNRWDIRNGSLASNDGNPWNLTVAGTNMIALVNATVDDRLGNIDIQSGTFAIQTSTLTDSSSWAGNANHVITVETNATLEVDFTGFVALGQTLVFNDGSTLQNDGSACVLNGPVTLAGGNVNVFNTAATTVELDGVISGPGGFTKNSAASMTLTAADTYTGGTAVNAGTLFLTGSGAITGSTNITIAAGATVDVSALATPAMTLGAGQTLRGNGLLNGSLVVGTGATVAPGTNAGSIGLLTVTNSVTLGGTTVMKLSHLPLTNDVISAASVTFGGTLNLVGLTALQAGDSFQLFPAGASYSGAFAAIVPATPGAGLLWNTNSLATGMLSVVSGVVPQPHITGISLTGTSLVINGTNGLAGESYNVLTTTNLALPLANWTVLPTNTFTAGNFSLTNTVNPGAAQSFYILRVP